MPRAAIESLLHSALAENHLPPVVLDAQGTAEVRVNGLAVHVEYAESTGTVYLYCSLGVLPQEVPVSLYETVLEANLLGAGTGGGHIGLHSASRILAYSLALDETRLQSREVGNALLLFTQHAARWMEKVHAQLQSPQVEPPPFAGSMLNGLLWG